MFKFLDDFIDKAIDKIKIFWNSGKESVYDFVSKYEKMVVEGEKELKQAEKELDKIASNCSGTYEENEEFKDCLTIDNESECSKHSGCTWLEKGERFEIKPSPYYSCSAFVSCASPNNFNYIMRHKINGGEQVYNHKGECKNFYYKRYKSKENFEKAINKFMSTY